MIITAGAIQPRRKPEIGIAVLRDGPSVPSALHREEIVHGDVVPSNIMPTGIGNTKVLDIGAAFAREDGPLHAGLRRAQRPDGVGGLGTIESTLGRRPSRSCIRWGDSRPTSTLEALMGGNRRCRSSSYAAAGKSGTLRRRAAAATATVTMSAEWETIWSTAILVSSVPGCVRLPA